MNKIVILLTGMLVAGFVTVKTTDFLPEQALDSLQEDTKLQEKLDHYQLFKTSFDATLLALESGAISLSEAQTQTLGAARENHPAYLGHLIHEEAGNTDAERVAQNLVGHLRTDLDPGPERALRLRGLENELIQFKRAIRDQSGLCRCN